MDGTWWRRDGKIEDDVQSGDVGWLGPERANLRITSLLGWMIVTLTGSKRDKLGLGIEGRLQPLKRDKTTSRVGWLSKTGMVSALIIKLMHL